MAKLLYKPFGLVAGFLAGKLAATLFETLWIKFDRKGELPPPDVTHRDVPTARAVTSAALQAATFAGTRTAVDRVSLKWFEHLTGLWAGAKKEKDLPVSLADHEAAIR